VHDLLRLFRCVLDAYPERMAVGEVGITDLPEAARYYGRGDELELVFNFSFWAQPWSPAAFARVVGEVERTLPAEAWPAYTLSNHDLSRAATRYGPERAQVAAVMLLTLRGTPFLYYGEEIGMTDVQLDARWTNDPDDRDGARTPMQWEPGLGAGFTTGSPWLPVPPTARTANVTTELQDPRSLLNLYRRLLQVRCSNRALQLGSCETVLVNDAVFVYLRELDGERLLVALNFADHSTTCPFDDLKGTYLLSTHAHIDPGEHASLPLRLEANEGIIIRLEVSDGTPSATAVSPSPTS
jgi:alpha-glucosidase